MNRKTKYYLIFTGYSLVLTVLVSIISKEIIDPIKILAMAIGPHIMYWFIVGGVRLQLKVISFACSIPKIGPFENRIRQTRHECVSLNY